MKEAQALRLQALRLIHKTVDVKIDSAIHALWNFLSRHPLNEIDVCWEEVVAKLRHQASELSRIADIIEREVFG